MKIGILGMSPGNAHPSSWASIINGRFDGNEITTMGFPAVTAYLQANKDTIGLPGVEVTHVWAQNGEIADRIAKSAGIKNVVSQPEDMIGQIDAVILARDDADLHVEMAEPFIQEDVPIFIDKPLAINVKDLDWFENQVTQGKFIMSCSSMRYSNECRILKQNISSLGQLELVTAVGKKDWLKYGVHMVEAMVAILDDLRVSTVQHIGQEGKDVVHVIFENGLSATIHLFMNISGTFQLSFFGRERWELVEIKNSYSMFRDNIIEFVRSINEGTPRLEFYKTKNIIQTVIAAEKSRRSGGETITINI